LSCNNHISSIFITAHLSVVYVVLLKVLTKACKTHNNGLPYFLPAKQWFGNALPKAMKTCF